MAQRRSIPAVPSRLGALQVELQRACGCVGGSHGGGHVQGEGQDGHARDVHAVRAGVPAGEQGQSRQAAQQQAAAERHLPRGIRR